MKKLLLLLLVMTGMVSTASAAKKRIFVKQEISGWNSNISTYGLNLFLEKESSAITAAWPGSPMTELSDGWFYIDIDSEESGVTACLICPVTNDYWYVGSDYRPTINLSSNNVLYLYENDSKAKISAGTFTGYAIADGYTISSNTLLTLTQSGLKLTGALDFSSQTGNKEFWVFPTIVSSNTYYVGALAIRPVGTSNFSLSAFTKYEDAINYGDSYKWVESAHQKYDVVIDLAKEEFTFTPYRTTTIGGAGYVTWSNDEKYTVSGATAYTVEDKGSYAKLNAQAAGTVFPAGTGLVLGGSGEVTISASNETAATITGNNLVGSGNNGASIAAGSYVLYWDGSDAATVGFSKSAAGTLGAHKAYLPASSSSRSFLSFNEEATGINEVATEIENSAIFNLQGVRLNKMQKGLNIVNGKKLMVK